MREFGLIGRPLGHSRSAEYFTEKFSLEGLTDCSYALYDLEEIDRIDALLDAHPDLCGFNVTIPYKERILPFLDAVSEEAERIGAVNCVRREGGRLVGYNTDAIGLRSSLGEFLAGDRPESALILGTGGASKAVQYVLAEMDIPFALVSRDPARGHYTYDDLPCEAVAEHRLLINATPVGTYPACDEAPRIPYACVSPSHRLFDLVYNPPLTRFLDCGRRRGARIRNGEGMFVAQAEASWAVWNASRCLSGA